MLKRGIYIISHWSEATIYRTSKASISRLLANISPNNKRENTSAVKTDLFSLSACNRGLGLVHTVFVRTNAMLAFSGIFKFSAKNITLFLEGYFPIVFL